MTLSDKINKPTRMKIPVNWIAEENVKKFIKELMKRLEKQMIEGSKLKFSHTIITIKELAGKKLL